jgi:hypothetical protein
LAGKPLQPIGVSERRFNGSIIITSDTTHLIDKTLSGLANFVWDQSWDSAGLGKSEKNQKGALTV